MNKSYENLKKLSEKNGEIEYQAAIPLDILSQGIMEELAEIAVDFSMPGFRKGKVPHEVVREHVGEMELLENAANTALRDAMQQIVADEKIGVLGRPQITLMKLAPKTPVEFKIRYALAPEISLPDYKKIGHTIAQKEHPMEVTDKEVDEAITRIQSMIMPPAETGKENEAVPALNDETVKQLGPFKDLEAFRVELKKNLLQEKQLHAKDGDREEIVKEIVKNTKMKVPELLIEEELYDFLHDRDEQLKAAGLSLDDYLKQTGKTAQELEKDEHALIEQDIRTSLIIQEIRKRENVVAEERDVQISIARLKQRYPERDELSLRRTAEALIIQEKLFDIIQGIEKKTTETEPHTETHEHTHDERTAEEALQ